MIRATVSSQSCFCWLYRASLSLAAKNIINLLLVSTIWSCPCVESSLVLLEEGVCLIRLVKSQCILLVFLKEDFLAILMKYIVFWLLLFCFIIFLCLSLLPFCYLDISFYTFWVEHLFIYFYFKSSLLLRPKPFFQYCFYMGSNF